MSLDIDIRADYGAQFDYAGNPLTCFQYDCEKIQAALNYIGTIRAPGVDVGGTAGGILQLPPLSALINDQVFIPPQCRPRGEGAQSTLLQMGPDFPTNKDFIVDHNPAIPPEVEVSSVNTGIEHICLRSTNRNADAGRAMLRFKRAQHGIAAKGVKIMAGNSIALRAGPGHGGAAYAKFEDVETNNDGIFQGGNLNPQVLFEYGTTIIVAKNFVVQGPSDVANQGENFGIVAAGGIIKLKESLHFENMHCGLAVYPNVQKVKVDAVTGSQSVHAVAQLQNGLGEGLVTFDLLKKNGAQVAVIDGRPGKSAWLDDIINTKTF